jgi:hypothetical protein
MPAGIKINQIIAGHVVSCSEMTPSSKNFDHRKQWMESELQPLSF